MNKAWEFMKSQRCTGILINILLIFAVFSLGVILFWQLYPYKILEVQEGNYGLEKLEYQKGEVLNIRLKVCKTMTTEEDIYGRFVDGVIFSVPENTSVFEKGCYDTHISSVSVPDTLPVGSYVYEETIIYHPNPLRTIEYRFKTPEFVVVE